MDKGFTASDAPALARGGQSRRRQKVRLKSDPTCRPPLDRRSAMPSFTTSKERPLPLGGMLLHASAPVRAARREVEQHADHRRSRAVAHDPPGRADHRRHDVRVLRRPGGEEAQPARGRLRHGQLRHREGTGHRSRRRAHRGPHRHGGANRLHRQPAGAARTDRRATRRRPGRRSAHPAAHLHRAHRAGGGPGDGPGLAVHLLAMAVVGAGRPGGGLRRCPVPPRRVDQPAPRRRDHGHPRFHGHPRGVRLVGVGAVLRHRRHPRHGARVQLLRGPHRRRRLHLPRGRCRSHRVSPRGAVLRGARQAPRRGRAAGTAGDGRQGGRRPAPRRTRRRGGGPGSGRPAPRGREVSGPSRREDCHRRRGHRGHQRRGRLDAHRRIRARRGAARRRRGRRHGQRRRPVGGTGHPDRRGYPARPDGEAGRGGTDRQGAGSAAGRPRLGGVRPGRHRAGVRHPGLLAGRRRRRHGRLHRRCGRTHHRLPVRSRPGHPDGAAGGHGPRCPVGHPHPRSGDPGVHPPGRHRAAGQDRHRHDRTDVAGGRRRRGHRPGRGAAAGRRAGGGVRAPDRPRDRRRRARPKRRPARLRGRRPTSPPSAGSACTARWRAAR